MSSSKLNEICVSGLSRGYHLQQDQYASVRCTITTLGLLLSDYYSRFRRERHLCWITHFGALMNTFASLLH